MREFLGVILAFVSIPILIKFGKFRGKKLPMGFAICIAAIIMALAAGIGPLGLWKATAATFGDINKIKMLIVALEVTTLGALLKRYNIIDRALEHLTGLIGSRRFQLAFIPALVGLLSVPGGAIISAPFVDQLGEKGDVPKTDRAIINLTFRHFAMHVMPYTNGFIMLAALVPGLPIYRVLLLNLIFVVCYLVAAFFLYVRGVKEDDQAPKKSAKEKMSHLISLLKYTSTIYVSVLLNLIFGVPFHIGMLANYLMAFLLVRKKTIFIDIFKSIDVQILITMAGVYLIQGVISQLTAFTASFGVVFENPNTILLGIILCAFFFGLSTGFSVTAFGVVIPFLLNLNLSESAMVLYCHMMFSWGFIGYYFSPLHLCQLFTCQYMGVQLKDLYKRYFKLFIALTLISLSLFFVAQFFML